MKPRQTQAPVATQATRVAVIAAMALTLGACGTIPESGAIERVGPVIQEDQRAPFVDVIAAAPRPGDTEKDIADGFLVAMASYDPGFDVARQFLSPEAAATWQPSSGITVYGTAGLAQDATTPGTVGIDLPVVGRVAGDGSYRRAVAGEREKLEFKMAKVDGEWRIDTPPDGLVMTDFEFNRGYRVYSRYLFDPAFEVLVPDGVWLPRTGSLSTLLATALLAGPSDWLSPAVASAIPEGTTLGIRSVPVESGVARVDLSDEASEASPEERDLLAAQFARTLSQVDGVEAVALTVDGIPLVLPDDQGGVREIDADQQFDPQVLGSGAVAYGLDGGRVVEIGEEEPTAIAGPFGEDPGLRSLALSVDQSSVAGVTESGRALRRTELGPNGSVIEVAIGADLSEPSFDRHGVLWAVDRGKAANRRVLAFAPDGTSLPVDLDGEIRATAIKVSLDGTRAVLIAEEDGTRVLRTAIVVRGEGRLEVGNIRDPRVELQAVADVAWFSPTSFVALAESPGSPGIQPFQVDLDAGVPFARGPVVAPQTLGAAPGRQLLIGAQDERLLRQDSVLRWVDVGQGQSPAYPG